MKVYQHRVRYHEVDAQGFMFNARFLEVADVAMAEYFRHLGWTYSELNDAGADPSVVSANLTFRGPARHDDVVDVEVTCGRVGTSSFDLAFSFLRGTGVLCVADLVYVNVDPQAAVSRPLPSTIAETLRAQSNADEGSSN